MKGRIHAILALLLSAAASGLPAAPKIVYQSRLDYLVGKAPAGLCLADLDGNGFLDAAVASAESDSIFVSLNDGRGRFLPGAQIPVGNEPIRIAAADFNRDGGMDLAVANKAGGSVSILLNQGNGAFGPQSTISAGGEALDVAAADLDRDGKPDLVIATTGGNVVQTHLGKGDGAFFAPLPLFFAAWGAPLCVGDIDADGDPDLVEGARIHWNNGVGSFPTYWSAPDGTVSNPKGVALADQDGDGKLDLFLADPGAEKILILRFVNATTFAGPLEYVAGTLPCDIAAGDFDKDGDADFAALDSQHNEIHVFRSSGPLAASETLRLAVGYDPLRLAAGDLDGDGRAEICCTAEGSYASGVDSAGLGVFKNLGGGAFASSTELPLQGAGDRLGSGDFNHDGIPDLVSLRGFPNGDATAEIRYGTGDGAFLPSVSLPSEGGGARMDVSDMNGDGFDDLLFGGLGVALNLTDGHFGPPATYSLDSDNFFVPFSRPMAADMDSDGDPDVLLIHPSLGPVWPGAEVELRRLYVFDNTGTGALDPPAVYDLGLPIVAACAVCAADLNNDQRMDVALTTIADDHGFVSILLGTREGSLAPPVHYPWGGWASFGVAAGDLDGDGDVDIAVGGGNEEEVAVLWNVGGGVFSAPGHFEVGDYVSEVFLRDFDGDRRLDILAHRFHKGFSVLCARGSGGFDAPVHYGGGALSWELALADFNLDGKPDVASVNSISTSLNEAPQNFSIFLNIFEPEAAAGPEWRRYR